MSKIIALPVLAALATFTLAAPVSAQSRSTVSGAALETAITAKPVASNRAIVNSALSSPEAIAAAGKMGVSADQLSARVAALDDAAVNDYAARIRAGGSSSVVISTTAIIIALLILILLLK
ncbi:MAG: hypothetical protein ABIZ70_14860 [Gemmatimonadales bacterium]